jgi:putative oxidoreductase
MSTTTTLEHTPVDATNARALNATDFGLLILRLALGVIFFAHGAQKVFGWFGGYGLSGTVKFMTSTGIPAPLAYLACFTELLGGLAVLGGLLARLASAGLAVVMLVAIMHIHLSAGFFAPKGFEFPLALLSMALMLIVTGPGRIAIADIEGKLLARRR